MWALAPAKAFAYWESTVALKIGPFVSDDKWPGKPGSVGCVFH